MNPPETEAPSRPRRWHPWPVGIVLAVLTGMAINITMVVIAQRNVPVMAEKGDYYAHSLAWQGEIDTARASAALGLQAAVTATGTGILVQLRDANGAPVTGQGGSVKAERNDTEAFDFEAPLAEVAPGDYRALRPHRKDGLYRLRLTLAPTAQLAVGESPRAAWVDERLLVLP